MKTINGLIVALVVASTFFMSSCDRSESVSEMNSQEEKAFVNASNQLDLDLIALSVIDVMADPVAKNEILQELQSNKNGIEVQDFLSSLKTIQSESGLADIEQIVEQSKAANSTVEEHGVVEVPELWLYEPSVPADMQDCLYAYAPQGEEENWEYIRAYNSKKEVVYLDPYELPKVPVIVIESKGHKALELQVSLMNKQLAQMGARVEMKSQLKASSDLETTMLKKIRMNDDKEPWIKGKAEIYAVTSGIRMNNGKGEPQINIIALPYLDEEDKDYYPNQILLFWDDYAYQAANIQFFEQDSNYNYKELVSILVEGVFDIAAIASEQAWLPIVGKMASKIIEVIPDNWWTDGDDYADSFYTLMKDRIYSDQYGAAGNVKVTLEPFTVPAN